MFSFFEGSDFTAPVTCTDRQGTAIDLTGATSLQARIYHQPIEDDAVLVTLNVVNGGIVVNSNVGGQLSMVFEPGDLTPGDYVYEITATLSSGNDVVLGRGWLKVATSHAL